MKRRLEAQCGGAAGMAQSVFPGIRPSASRWAMWVIAGQWLAAVAIVIWAAAKWGWGIDEPGECGYTALFVVVVHGCYVGPMTRDLSEHRSEAAAQFWRFMAYPPLLSACLTIAIAMAAPHSPDLWTSVREDRDRMNGALLSLAGLAVAMLAVRAVVGRAFPPQRESGVTQDAETEEQQ